MAANANPKPFRDLVDHHRDLFVDPLLWTYRHLDLVGCRFEDVDTTITESTQDDCRTDDDQRPSQKLPSNTEQLATNPFPTVKYRCLVNLLVGEGRAFAKIRSPPLVGYLHYTNVNGDRRRKFEPCPGPNGSLNFIGARILKIRLAQIAPKEWTKDPYFVCILLALAQLQERKLESSKPITYTSRLLVTNISDREYIHFYEAKISAELLGVLRGPRTTTEYTKWPTIQQRKLPFKPYDTFGDRIMAELVAPSLCFHETSTMSYDLNGVVECGIKRPYEQENNKSHKMKRII
ncbi:uncharacterized protein N7479_006432 [Penicillium vulpinum]|uniref:uncharacterized protein n=1 Tax=Penicillium vulpinum TaxID=29845 RepID=UPI0025480B0A|nr:uncharacterized protein N7479_006432 [Penicillium vulpinum]KAJ5959282.1 hypothetical protein N7479_006432 [Penicillium vulpinum]